MLKHHLRYRPSQNLFLIASNKTCKHNLCFASDIEAAATFVGPPPNAIVVFTFGSLQFASSAEPQSVCQSSGQVKKMAKDVPYQSAIHQQLSFLTCHHSLLYLNLRVHTSQSPATLQKMRVGLEFFSSLIQTEILITALPC